MDISLHEILNAYYVHHGVAIDEVGPMVYPLGHGGFKWTPSLGQPGRFKMPITSTQAVAYGGGDW